MNAADTYKAIHPSKLVAFVIALTFAAAFDAVPAIAQPQIGGQLTAPPPRRPAPPAEAPAPGTPPRAAVQPTPTATESILFTTEHQGRAAVFADTTRLAEFSDGTFLPSAIPVEGQPFFDSDTRANVQGSGSAVRLNAYGPTSLPVTVSAHTQVVVRGATFPGTGDSDDTNLTLRQAFGRLNRLTVGLKDSQFSDPSALPETIDLAGPNARITVCDAGTGDGQALMSYDLLTDDPHGLEIILSVEQAIPEIEPPGAEEEFAHYPDFVCATQYVAGDYVGEDREFFERWHLQWASVARDLALESPAGGDENEFGWGTALSGAYRLQWDSSCKPADRIVFSVAYGEGISHYITDLNAAEDTGDAVVNAAGALEALPAFATYIGYTHYWTERLRSTATVSHVDLDSTLPLVAAASPYRSGDFVAINLIYHTMFSVPDVKGDQHFFTGVEYLFGQKETLDGAEGDAHRVMFVIVIAG